VLLPLSDESLLHMYDTELGPLARQFAYGFFLQAKNRPYWDGLLCHEQGWLWHALYFFMGGYLHACPSFPVYPS